MRNLNETAPNTLSQIRDRQLSVSHNFERAHSSVRHRLRSAVLQAKSSREIVAEPGNQATPFGSAWLPGPLSYPWLLMLAGIPKIIDQLIRQV